MPPPHYDFLLKLLLIGDSGVGKSCLLLRFADNAWTPSFITTIGIDFKVRTAELNGKRIKYQIWDTAGHERFRTIISGYFGGAMGILLVYDVTNEKSFDNIRMWHARVEQRASEGVDKMLIGNKSDWVDKRAVTEAQGRALADELGMKFMETSAKANEGVEDAFFTLAREVMARLVDSQPGASQVSGNASEGMVKADGGTNAPVTGRLENHVISSLLSTSEIIALLGERGCKNLSASLDLQACSQYPISTGGFGDVYSCRLQHGTKVAIKAMRPYVASGFPTGKYQKRTAKELYTWSRCDHPNVARLLGLAEFRGQLAMISEWAENGTLSYYIQNNPSANRCALCISICEGLVYLHECNIVHGDLKGANVLISSNGTPMLIDFGNASLGESTVSFTATTSSPSFSLRWAAPEIIKESSPHSRAGDVYALGMTILETITGQVPFSNVKDIYIPRTVVDKKKTPPRPEEQIPTRSVFGNILWALLMSCWVREPGLRPSAAQVRDVMKPLTQEALAYVEPEPDSEDES